VEAYRVVRYPEYTFTYITCILILSSDLRLHLPRGLYPSICMANISYNSIRPHACYMRPQSISFSLYPTSNKTESRDYEASHYATVPVLAFLRLCLLVHKYSTQYPVLRHPQSVLLIVNLTHGEHHQPNKLNAAHPTYTI
jgi:hypothetical protein